MKMNATTSSAHLELLIGGQLGTSSTAYLRERETVARDAPPLREVGVMDAFGVRRPLGLALTYRERVGAVVMVVGVALIVLAALFS
jgi:hypothetical protein